MLSYKILCIKPFDASGTDTSGSHGRGCAFKDTKGYYRQDSGSNYWGDSNIRDWLNSTASAGNVVWSCGNPPDESHVRNGYNEYDQEVGFLNNFTSAERSIIKEVTQKQLLDGYEYSDGNKIKSSYHKYDYNIADILENYNTAYSETTTDKMFLLDVKQLYNVFANRDTLGSGYYKAKCTASAVSDSEYVDSNISTSSDGCYWLRSPYANSYNNRGSFSVRCVSTSGKVINHVAEYNFVGVRFAFYLNTSIIFKFGNGSEGVPYRLTNDVTTTESTTELTTTMTTESTTESTTTTTESTTKTTTESTTVSTTESTTELTTESTSELTTATTVVYSNIGDVDASGRITANDSAFIIQRVLDSSFELPCTEKYNCSYMYIADVTGDKLLSAADAAAVLQKSIDSGFEFDIVAMLKNDTYMIE